MTRSSRRSSSAPIVVIPQHYDTFPPIATDAQAYKAEVEAAGHARVELLAPGESYEA